MFDEVGVRLDVKKFLIVFMDNKLKNDRIVIVDVFKLIILECGVVFVGVGEEVDKKELEVIIFLKNIIVIVLKIGNFDEVVKEIIDKMKKSKFLLVV